MWNVEEDEVQLAAVGVFLPLFKIKEKLKKIEKDGKVWNLKRTRSSLVPWVSSCHFLPASVSARAIVPTIVFHLFQSYI